MPSNDYHVIHKHYTKKVAGEKELFTSKSIEIPKNLNHYNAYIYIPFYWYQSAFKDIVIFTYLKWQTCFRLLHFFLLIFTLKKSVS